jgi:predicted lipoprotein
MKLTPLRYVAIAGVVVVALLAVTRPWVVRPLDAQGKAIVGPAQFDPEAYTRKLWDGSLASRSDGAVAISQATAAAKFLKGEGVVMAIDTKSRVGVASVDIDPQDGKADVLLQIGPVIAGSALRDAFGLNFDDFDTQVDYANVSGSLNKRALKAIPLLSDPQALRGKRISFVGAGQTAPDGQVRVVPVRLALLP